MAVPDTPSQLQSHPQGPLLWPHLSSHAAGADNAKVHNRHPESWNVRVGRASDQPTYITGEEERKDHMRPGSPPPARVPTESRSH